ncbi:hypothetical protein SS50377_25574 [Spironucleus salmonicida]|uniref:Uncharacterized protein n=1 Tax=Spironucleus salmonicida TaxID=348837 RepID=V6LN37_9EUKA|nr:hypothetical protein SS50377_25574 [Spironucleus salmonicida]|eukprot:EST45121.1 Hypothetical protein SS50377_15142 [Spironucleus salmonicida]
MLESCRHYSQNFPAKLIKTALLHGVPKQILFDLVSFNPPECRSVRQFRRQHFGQIASIFKYKDKWIVRPRGEFQGEKVDSVYMQNLMFEKLLKESQIVEKCIAKNAEILVRRSNRVVDSGTQKKEIRQWVNKGKRLSSGQKRFEKWRVKKQQ